MSLPPVEPFDNTFEFTIPSAIWKTFEELQIGTGNEFLTTNVTKKTITKLKTFKYGDEAVKLSIAVMPFIEDIQEGDSFEENLNEVNHGENATVLCTEDTLESTEVEIDFESCSAQTLQTVDDEEIIFIETDFLQGNPVGTPLQNISTTDLLHNEPYIFSSENERNNHFKGCTVSNLNMLNPISTEKGHQSQTTCKTQLKRSGAKSRQQVIKEKNIKYSKNLNKHIIKLEEHFSSKTGRPTYFQRMQSSNSSDLEPVPNTVCPVCKTTINDCNVLEHKEQCQADKANNIKSLSSDVPQMISKELHKCFECGNQYRSKQGFLKHLETMHRKLEKAQCPQCGITVKSSKHLSVHMKRIHSQDDELFLCHLCPAKFRVQNYLNGHLKTKHAKDNPMSLSCDQCSYKTSVNRYLRIHKARVHGEKRYVCKLCSRKFGNSSNLKRHIVVVHNIVD